MIAAPMRSQPDAGEKVPQPEVDGNQITVKASPASAPYRYYPPYRRVLRQITHEQHLAYGTWALAVGTGLFFLPGSAGQFFPSRTKRVEVYNIYLFRLRALGFGMGSSNRRLAP